MAGIFPQERSMAQRILENIIFIEEVFADRAEGEIPDIPVIELARSFELSHGELVLRPASMTDPLPGESGGFLTQRGFHGGMTEKS